MGFIVSPVTPISITAATAAAVKRKISDDLYNYNPDPYDRSSWSSGYGQSPVDASPSPSLVSVTTPSTLLNRNDVKMSPTPSPAGSETAKPTGYSYKTVHWPKSGLATGYNNFHFK